MPARSTTATVTSLADRRRRQAARTGRPERGEAPGARRQRGTAPPGRRSSSFVTLLGLVLVLTVIGLAMVLSASSVQSMEKTGSPWSQFLRQLAWSAIGLVALVLTVRRGYGRWREHTGWLLGIAAVLLVAVIIPGLGIKVGGARRWLGTEDLSIQPSELAKLALTVFWADLLARRARWIDHPRLTVVPVLLTFGICAALIMKQPNLGTVMVIFAIMLGMLFVAGAPLRWLTVIVGVGVVGIALAVVFVPFRTARVLSFLNPDADPQNAGYQLDQAQAAASEGGLIGIGLGQGRAKWEYLPEADNDFIFAVIAEEAGLVGGLLVISLFVGLAVVGTRVALRAPDRFGMLLASGITIWFLVQAFLNIGQAVGQLPVVGVPLPFVSSGGSALVVSMIASGMLLNISRQTS